MSDSYAGCGPGPPRTVSNASFSFDTSATTEKQFDITWHIYVCIDMT